MPRTRDIAQLAGAFNALLGRIADAVRAQREFAGNVAHELRTPLAGIRSLAEYGLSQARPEVWSRQLGLISQSERRASHLVEQLLALALADEARNSLRLVPVPVHEVVQELLTRLLTQADDLGVDLGAAGLERPVWVLGTRGLVEGILGNLTDNALRYGHCTQPGQESRVTVEIECQSSQVQISVTDNGPGLSAEERQRVRSRWEQGALGTRSAGGVGLGLAIVERYVALLGGDFALEAAPGGPGLRAVVWLRAVSDPQMDGKSGPPATFAAVSSAVSSAVSEAVPEAVPEADPVTAAPALASALALPPSLPGRPASQGLSAPR
jgi:two-component system sensor histidine kinase TctE